MGETIFAILEPISIVVGIALAIPVVWTWFDVVFGERRRRRERRLDVIAAPADRPALLVMDLLTGVEVTHQVEAFRQQDPVLSGIPAERIVVISRDRRVEAHHMPELVAEIRAARKRLLETGVDRIHLFFAGPGVVAAVVGAQFANGTTVILHQHDHGKYVNMGPLKVD
jgi:hypothetical protein